MNHSKGQPPYDNHWLTRPATIRGLWIVFSIILAATVFAQFVIPVKGKFPLESSFGFAAWFGFVACVAMVLVAKVAGWVLKRPEDYYEDQLVKDPGKKPDGDASEGASHD